jgi:catechol 2,3-dioxygenase-like lactoylglutathione lyase family enzyme
MSHHESPQITGVRTVGVPVTDQDQALDFYVGTLGLEKRADMPLGGGRRWIEVAPAGAATTIALVAAHEGVPAGVETGIRLITADAGDPFVRNGLVSRWFIREWLEVLVPEDPAGPGGPAGAGE